MEAAVTAVVALVVGFGCGVVYPRRDVVSREDWESALAEIRRLRSALVGERDRQMQVFRPPYDWEQVRRRGGGS